MSEAEITQSLRAVRRGDCDAYEKVVARYQKGLRAYMLRCAPDPEEADDLAQTAFITAYERIERFDLEADFGAWLFGIARNLVRRAWEEVRDKRNLESMVQRRTATRAADADEDDSLLNALRACTESLPDRWREVVTLHYEKKRPILEISRHFGNSASTVAVTLFRLRHRLKECIGRRLSGERVES